LTYTVSCFAILQVADVLQEPLGLPDGSIRWLLLVMLAMAPVLVGTVGWLGVRSRQLVDSRGEPSSGQAAYRVGIAEIDGASRRISFDGKPADVQPKVFDLIEYLVRHRERVVSKDELLDEIWPSVVVTEASLTQSIKRARDLFRQHGVSDDVIRTVSRKGYQFTHAVARVAGARQLAPMPAWRTVALPTALVAVISLGLGVWVLTTEEAKRPVIAEVTYGNSLAVLPFNNLSADAGFAYFADGLTETVTNSLTRVRGLRVIATASTINFRETDTDFVNIGQQLRVGHLVQGSVQRDGDLLRITARLVRVIDGSTVWSQIYNRELDDVFSLHDDIARAIVQQMSGVLSASLDLSVAAPDVTGTSDDSEAYRLLLRGQAVRKRGANQDLETAASLFRQALELRPDYAEAMVALCDVIRHLAIIGELPRESGFSEALVLARRALVIDPELAEAWVQIGEIQHRHFWDFEAAADSYHQAIEINPGSASARSAYSRYLAKAGRDGEAVVEAGVALDLNPLSTNAAASLVTRLSRAGQLPEARRLLDDFKSRHPEHVDIAWLETNWHIRSGSYGDALQWSALEELDYLRLSLSAMALHYLGRTGQADVALKELIETDSDGAAFQVAEVYAQWGEVDLAFEWLNRAFRQGDPGVTELYSSLNLARLYADARFPELAEKIGLPAPPKQF
jgi:TolB-like protein/DNA-binding winged helix-turn-helix (wHTH) protein/Tfp pilus assembly protein PilF